MKYVELKSLVIHKDGVRNCFYCGEEIDKVAEGLSWCPECGSLYDGLNDYSVTVTFPRRLGESE